MSADAYLKARADFESTKIELSRLVSFIRTVAGQLSDNPAHFSFSNAGVGLPMDAIMSRHAKSADANQWPTPDTIMALLNKYHQNKTEMTTTWGAIPVSYRNGLTAPNL